MRPPEFVNSIPGVTVVHLDPSIKDKFVNSAYKLGSLLKQTADRQDLDQTASQPSIENYIGSIRVFNKALGVDIKISDEMLTNMSDVLNLREKYKDSPHTNQTFELDILLRHTAESVLERARSNYIKSDPLLVPILDNLARYYEKEILDSKSIPLMEQALSIEKAVGKNIDDLAKRYEAIAGRYSENNKQKAAEVLEGLLDTANNQFNNQDNQFSLRTLHQLSSLFSRPGDNVGGKYTDKQRSEFRQESLKYKEQEIAMATRMNANEKTSLKIAPLLIEKAEIQQYLGRNEDALKSLQGALTLDQGSLDRPSVVNRMISLYKDNHQFAEAETLIRQVLDTKNKTGSNNTVYEEIELAELLLEQKKFKGAEETVTAAAKSLTPLIKQAEKNGNTKEFSELQEQSAQAFAWLGQFYEKQNQPSDAAAAYVNLRQAAENILSDYSSRRSWSRDATRGLIRIYKGQGKAAEAKEEEKNLERLRDY